LSYDLRIIAATSAEWADWLAVARHDFYHTAAYHLLGQQCGEGEALLAVYGDRCRFLAWPHLRRPVSECAGLEDSTFYDVGSVYGYPGPILHNAAGADTFLERAWTALVEWWRSQRVVSVFTRCHPFQENQFWQRPAIATPVLVESPGSLDCLYRGVVPVGQTVSIDLTLPDSEVPRYYKKILRQEIGAGRRQGLRTAVDDDWTTLPDFIELYQQTMSRNHASAKYFFSHDYFRRLRKALGPHGRLMVTRLEDTVAAAMIVVEYQGLVHAHLAGSNDELKRLSPLKVLLDDVRRWAQERGDRVFHLGGGRSGKDDSLLAFKGRFSPRRHEFYIGKWVLEPRVYRELCDQRDAYVQKAGLVSEDDDFFPRYRTHLSSPAAPADSPGPSIQLSPRSKPLMPSQPRTRINLLFTSVGRRVELLRAFRRAYSALRLGGILVGIDVDPLAPGMQVVDKGYIVPPVHSSEYVPTLEAICRAEEIDLVLPLIDPDIRILACARPMLEAIGVAVGAVSVSAADITADKWRTHQFFETLDLPTPPSWLPAQILETDPQYPLFIKPRGGSAGKDGFRVENRRELEFFLDYVPNPMVQKCIEGPEITTDVLCDLDGTLLGVVSRRRIEVRSGEVAKGVTVRCQPVIDACVRIARDLPAVGPITVQCLMQGDTPCFTEINARLGGGIPLGIAAGFDVPLLLLGRCAGMPVGPPPLGSYETGLHITRFDDSFFLEEQRRVQIAGQHIELHRNSAV
jgi:carbamoyl-phosphate synthase large subunit